MIDSCVNTHLVRLSLVVGHRSLFFSNLASHLIIGGKMHKYYSLALLINLCGCLNVTACVTIFEYEFCVAAYSFLW